MFNEDRLKNYAAVVFLSTTGNVLDHYQEAAFERYIQAGGGYMGIHAAADCEYDWGWYGRLTGGYFLSHPGIHDTFPNVQEGVLNVVDQDNGATKHLPKQMRIIEGQTATIRSIQEQSEPKNANSFFALKVLMEEND